MRILQINKFHYLRGGAERYYFAVSQALQKAGHEVVHFSMKDPRNVKSPYEAYFAENLELARPGLKMIRHVSRSVWSREVALKLEKLLDTYPVDVAHVHLLYHHLSPSVLAVLKKRGIPVVMTLHDYKLICPNYLLFTNNAPCDRCKGGKYYQAVLNKCVKDSFALSAFSALEMTAHKWAGVYEKNVDVFIAPSKFVRDEFVKFGQNPSNIVVIPHFIDEAFFAKAEKTGQKQAPYALYFGRLSKEKGIDSLLELFYIYRPKLPLIIAGEGPLLAWAKEYVRSRSLSEQVRFLGKLGTTELAKWIKGASVTVVPSRVQETFGFSCVESLALGTPVVATALGALTELLPQDLGRLVPSGDLALLAHAVEEVSLWDKKNIASSARAWIEKNYTEDKHLASLLTVYQYVIKKHKKL